ncbi:Ig-like domain-containing protein [Arthrobacter sp. 35W]|uniref:Ig-like domain-containing protein n=1 Tax=Arthrobacter sp. 35W TaxID=1132441 RepID=UPI0018CB5587|nr:Ig-like domain-containing protein [Arthrobacter sp. 35W]
MTATSFGAIAAVVVGAAIIYPGFNSVDVDLNDGGVWVTNKSLNALGHLNYPSRVLDGGFAAGTENFDVFQDANTVLLDDGGSSLAPVDVAAVSAGNPVRTPGAVTVSFGAKIVAMTDSAAGAVWAVPAENLAAFNKDSTEPLVADAKDAASTVADDGTVVVATPGTNEVLRITVDAKGQAMDTKKTAMGQLSGTRTAQVASVGDKPVVLDAETGRLFLPNGKTIDLPDGKNAKLQQSGPASDFVAVETAKALIKAPLDGSAPTVVELGSAGSPVSPVQRFGCVYAAWAGSGQYIRDCADDSADQKDAIPGVSATSELTFRVNRNVVVLNDVKGGNVWLVQQSMQMVSNWDDVITPPDKSKDKQKESADENSVQRLPDRTKPNQPPVAGDDTFGVRAGKTTILPVLDNDSDPDGDLLTVQQEGDAPAFGTVQPVYGSTGYQVQVPADAKGSTTFRYKADDGRGGLSAAAAVTLTVREPGQNEAPKAKRATPTTILMEAGKTLSSNVLTDWMDPDGDDIFLESAVPTSEGDQVRFRRDGLLSFQDVGKSTGRKEVKIVVTDGTASTEGTVIVDVRPAKSGLLPVANFDQVSAVAGQETEIAPLLNDVDPAGGALRLTKVQPSGGAVITPDYEAGTFKFTAATSGVVYLEYIVSNGPQSATGLVRINVAPAGGAPGAPVAVRDTAYLPTDGEVLVDALANDGDPTGGVLVIQSVSGIKTSAISVAIVDHRVLRVTNVRGLTTPTTFNYTVSNGSASSVGEVSVVPVPAPEQLQPPKANPDETTVRANDYATINVLDNDTHPNGGKLTLKPVLVESVDPADGLLAVSGNVLRFKAGPTAKTVHAVYVVVGPDGQEDSSQVTINIKGGGAELNQPPLPRNVTARTVAGYATKVQIPLDGIDPDGDSVTLLGIDRAPAKGTVSIGSTYVEYTASANASGTDSFSYIVADRFGARGSGTVLVGIAPASSANQPPVAIDDPVVVLPGRQVAVDVLSNDSDPDGDPVRLDEGSLEFAEPIKAEVVDHRVLVTAPGMAGDYALHYTVGDGRGGTAVGAIKVHVTPDAPKRAPIARDDVVSFAETLGKTAVDVPVLKNDEDPDGVASQLAITLPQGGNATVNGGSVKVVLADEAQVVPYTVTDKDSLTSTAFIVAPGIKNQRPMLRSTAPLTVQSGQQLSVNLKDAVVVRKDKSPQITRDDKVSAVAADGSKLVKDATTLVFTSADDYAGPASISFEVADGDLSDPEALSALLTISINVTPDPNRNHPPTFSNSTFDVAKGEDNEVDLSQLAADPDKVDQSGLKFSVGNAPAGFAVSLSGGKLKVTAEASTPVGAKGSIEATVADPRGGKATGSIEFTAVSSKRPLAVAVDDVVAEAHSGKLESIEVLANDVNPFPDTPLKLTGAKVETGEAAVSASGSRVDVTPAAGFVGTLVVSYQVQDKTADLDRTVTGRIRLTVKDKPAPPTTPTVAEVRDKTVVLNWSPPQNNGSPITGYTVKDSKGASTPCPATTCTISGLVNDVEYTFTVTATNGVGESDASAASATARPDNRPEAPAAPTLVFGDKQITVNWTAPVNTGSAITDYTLEISPAPASGVVQKKVAGGTLSTVWDGLDNGTAYRVRIQAANKAPEPSAFGAYSAPEVPAAAPAAPAKPATARGTAGGTTTTVVVTWVPPATNGAAIDQYTVAASRGGSVVLTKQVPGTETSIGMPLANSDTDYTFSVSARNKAGESPVSVASDPRRAFGAPGAVTGLTATPLDNAIQLAFGPAEGNGATPTYLYSLGGGYAVVPADKRIAAANNGSYTVSVKAQNVVAGEQPIDGPVSTAGPVEPYGQPNAPSVGVVNGAKTVTFNIGGVAPNGRPVQQINWTLSDGRTGSVGPGGGSIVAGNDYDQSWSISAVAIVNSPPVQQTSAQGSNSGRTAARPMFRNDDTASGGTCEYPDPWAAIASQPSIRANCATAGGTWRSPGYAMPVECIGSRASYPVYSDVTKPPDGSSSAWTKQVNGGWFKDASITRYGSAPPQC